MYIEVAGFLEVSASQVIYSIDRIIIKGFVYIICWRDLWKAQFYRFVGLDLSNCDKFKATLVNNVKLVEDKKKDFKALAKQYKNEK